MKSKPGQSGSLLSIIKNSKETLPKLQKADELLAMCYF
jgi:hypothetical protein